MIEIRGHARGGQGMVTAFEILAKVFSQLGDFQVQAFPAFGVERTGAPIQAFLRVGKGEILNRSNIYHPHLIVVFDESLIDQVPVFDGLKDGGAILLNTETPREAFFDRCKNVFTVPATQISIDKGLGSKSLPIVNAAMIGAIVRIFEANLDITKTCVAENVPVKPEANAASTEVAYNKVIGLDKRNQYLFDALHSRIPEKEKDIQEYLDNLEQKPMEALDVPFWTQPMSKNKTGNWRLLSPNYEDKAPPCSSNCPAGTDVRAFVRLAGEHKFEEARDIIYEHNPFPSACGRVCPHFCEHNCNRNSIDSGLNIGAIERYVGDFTNSKPFKANPIQHKEKIAVIGAGPAGLTAALRLRKKGYATTVFEAMPKAGGMMRSGIPSFRLPDDVLDREIKQIENQGVELKVSSKVNISDLSDEFDAVITAVGSHIGTSMGLDKESLLEDGIQFLKDFKLDGQTKGIKKGDEVAVIGGGNTAIDVARTALRLGAHPTIYYRRTGREMPAIAQEVEEAKMEGVKMQFLCAPVGIMPSDGQLRMDLIQMKLTEPDESGRRRPVPIEGSEQQVVVDKVIKAIGQSFDAYVFNGTEVAPKQGRIESEYSVPVFCAGDMAWGGTVTEAIGSGNKVAEEVVAHFKKSPYTHDTVMPEVVLPDNINFAYYLPTPRLEGKVHHPKDFYNDFEEVVAGLEEKDIVSETARCLHCGECFSCGNCYNYCPDAAILIDDHGRLRIDYDYCKGCGICVQECPSSAITFELMDADN